jgi:hypothetical protein
MGRIKKFASQKERQAAYRVRQRQAAGKPAPLTEAQRRAAARAERARDVAAIRASLIRRGAVELADRLYPQNHCVPEATVTPVQK